jgi:hypothetical protein
MDLLRGWVSGAIAQSLQVLSSSDALRIATSGSSGTTGSEVCSPYSFGSGTSANTVFGASKHVVSPMLSGSPKPPISPYQLMSSESWSWETAGPKQSHSPGDRSMPEAECPQSSGTPSPGDASLLEDLPPKGEPSGDSHLVTMGPPNGGSSSLSCSMQRPPQQEQPMHTHGAHLKSFTGRPPSFPRDRIKSSGSLSGFVAAWASRRRSVDSMRHRSMTPAFGSRHAKKSPVVYPNDDLMNATSPETDVERSVFSAPIL